MFFNNINVIGGSDGPTAIFITSRFSPLWIVAAAAVICAIGLALFLRRRKK